jgi:glycine betaine/proline transport system substrate-binding protein
MKKAIVPVAIVLVLVGFYVYTQHFSGDQRDTVGQIIGIDPGSGIMNTTTNQTIPAYKLPLELQSSSDAAMTQELGDAIRKKEWIVVTGWTPHWMFARWDLKYLDDPKNTYGGKEEIRTLARKGLKEDMPKVYEFLDQFYWSPKQMADLMAVNRKGGEPYDNAKQWIQDHPQEVRTWLDGVVPLNGTADLGHEITIANVAWSTETASANVVKAILQERLGCTVEIDMLTAAFMYEAVAKGDAECMVGAWLPTLQKGYYEAVKDEVIDLGPNLKGTKSGLVVPAYVTIDSIEDLSDRETAAKFGG